MQTGRTDITIVLDRSGTMQSIRADMEGGLKTFLDEQAALPGECTVTLWQFDDVIEKLWSEPIAERPAIHLVPRGTTALLDAWGRAMVDTGERLAAIPEADRPEHVVFVVITDGLENASKEWTHARVREMVAHQETTYSWTFVYLGANQDAVDVGAGLGLHAANASNYAPTTRGVTMAYAGLSNSVANLRGGKGWDRVPDAT